MPAQTASLPRHASIWSQVRPGDFLDDYAVATPLSARDALQLALQMPGWAAALLRLRNALVRLVGLKTAGGTGLFGFPVVRDTEDEIVLGFDDRHLDFRITALKSDGTVHISTWVRRNNVLGRLYLALVLPVHARILRGAIRRIARAG